MHIEQLSYWFFDPSWWMGASQGAVGALIGFGGLFAAYRLSQRGDKERRREEQTLAAVASIMQTGLVLYQKQPYEVDRQELGAFEKELMLFSVHQLRHAPDAAEWARSYSNLIRKRSTSPEGVAIARRLCGSIVQELADWLSEGYPKGKLKAENIEDEWAEAVAEIEEGRRNTLSVAPLTHSPEG